MYGKHFDVYVDHKALQYIFKPTSKLSAKIFRWQLDLQRYDFTVHYTRGKEHIADFISRIRNTQISVPEEDYSDVEEYVNFITNHNIPKTMSISQINKESENDKLINAFKIAIIRTGKWYEQEVKRFESLKHEFTEHDGIVLRGHRIMVPEKLKLDVMEIVHQGHIGISKSKAVIREKLYWPALDKDVENYNGDCIPCKANSKLPTPEPVTMSELPSATWTEISKDFFGPVPSGEKLLVIIDLYSRFPLVEIMKKTTENSVINRLEKLFSIFRYPEKIKHDNGPPFNSYEFRNYLKSVNIVDAPITPEHPEANAVVENFNKSLKKVIRTANFEQKNWRSEVSKLLLNYRNAPHATTGKCPSLLFFNRPLKTYLPSVERYKSKYDAEVRKRQKDKYEKVKHYTDMKRKAEKEINIGDKVLMKRGKIGKKNESIFYHDLFTVVKRKFSMITVEKSNGQHYTRNI